MKKVLYTLLFLTPALAGFSQKENNIWYFGRNAGIDFNSGVPVPLTNGMLNTSEGAATICDRNGNLLFYTDGQKVYNRNHVQMTNGAGLLGHASATQSAIIVPRPGSATRYYIFTVGSHDQYSGNPNPPIPLCWSEVDMTLNGGLGDVITATKNTQLLTGVTEKIAAVRHANKLFFWVITQVLSDGSYRAYLVDCNGVNTPVTSNLGHGNIPSGLGYLKVSPDARKLANAIWTVGYFLYDFDNATGLLSNRVDLGLPSTWAYGACFSPGGNLLYGVGLSDGVVYQWDLLAGSAAAIAASRVTVGNAGGTGSPYRGGAIQDGPDHKLYFIQYNQAYLGAIQNPDVTGTGCNLQQNVVNLGRTAVLGLPTLLQRDTDTVVISQNGPPPHCFGAPVSFTISGGAYLDSVRWDFGDPASGALNTSDAVAPSHLYTAPGSFQVKLIRYLACISDTVYATAGVTPVPAVDLGPDTVTCGDTVTLRSSVTYTNPSWLWNTGAVTSTLPVAQTGTYWLQVTENGCPGRDTIVVDISAHLTVDLGPDFNICDRDTPVVLHSPQAAGTHYLWSNGLSDTQMTVTRSGTYWLEVTRSSCTGSDSIHIGVIPTPSVYIGADTTICEQRPLQIGTDIPGAAYRWNTGETTPHISVSATNTYLLEVNLDGCIVYDTVNITAMPAPDIDLGPDGDICPEQTITLDGTYETGSTYSWNTGETSASIAVTSAGLYTVTVTSVYSCTGSDSILLSFYPKPTVLLGADTTVCEETPLLLIPALQLNTDSLRWSDGSVGGSLAVKYGGEYIVTAINKCGTDEDTIGVKQIFCEIMVPNAFTPNGDGINDVFRVLGNTGRMESFSLSIFSRWGELLFQTKDKYKGWDGTRNGQPSLLGTYVYMLEYSIAGKPYLRKGNFHLIR